VVAVVLLEVAVRLLMPQQLTLDAPELFRPDDEIGWRHSPNVRVNIAREGRTISLCTDAHGDRVSCEPRQARACERRILVIGDSFVEALSVSWEETVWHRLERATGACVESTGVGGYGPAQYEQIARERLADGTDYDLVLLSLYQGNDFGRHADRIPEAREVARGPLRLLPAGLSRREFRDWLYPLNQWLESRSHAWIAVREVIRATVFGDFVWAIIQPSRFDAKQAEPALRAVRGVAEQANHAGAPLLVVLVPISVQVLDPRAEAYLQRRPELAGDIDMDLGSRLIVPHLQELDARVVDLLPGLRARADAGHWGRIDPHFSSQGHELWFELIRGDVEALLASR
jgi:hypothetical protein